MTDERTYDLPGADTDETDDPTPDPTDDDETTGEGDSPWFKEGADAPDAADIEDPDAQR